MQLTPVLEPVTREGFDPVGYILANPDLQKARVDPKEHYEQHGQNEGRMQVRREIRAPEGAYRRRKFMRFHEIIDAPVMLDGFPAFVGTAHSLAEYQAESANDDPALWTDLLDANPDRNFLDLGCGLRRTVRDNCLYLEVYPSACADMVVAPDPPYPIRTASLDGVGCFAVLEHVRRPWDIVAEIRRILKPGGRLCVDWPFLQPVHGFPSHYFNATREGLRSLVEDQGFRIDNLGTGAHQGPDHTITWIVGHLVNRLPAPLRSRVCAMTVAELIDNPPQAPFWQELMSALDDEDRSTFACGNFLIATKGD